MHVTVSEVVWWNCGYAHQPAALFRSYAADARSLRFLANCACACARGAPRGNKTEGREQRTQIMKGRKGKALLP
jgi:hypothetical protein